MARHGQRGYDLLLFDVEAPEQRADAMRDLADRNRVAGLLVVSLPIYDHEIDALQRDDLPAVLLDVTHPRLPRVVMDNVHGGELAAEHLLAKGPQPHRLSSGIIPPTRTDSLRQRGSPARISVLRLRRAGIRLEPVLERFGHHGPRRRRRCWPRSLLRTDPPPTAIFAASDVQAIGVLKACEALGVRVPEDVAVIGFDDVDLAEIVGLTTIRQPLRESGGLAADLLVAAIEHGVHDPVEEVQALTVVERRTT